MRAEVIIEMLSGVRSAGTDKWTARCPAHEDRSPSLTIRQTDDRILIHCWTGCQPVDICWALGLTLADLFTESRYRPDPHTHRRPRAAEVLEAWRQGELICCAQDLRARDTIIRHIDRAVTDSVLTTDGAMTMLAYEYDSYTELEYRFTRLLCGEDALEIWRESRRSA